MDKLNVLVVNDDGVTAKGIKILALALKKYANVTVCAPDKGRSAASHSIILTRPLSLERVDVIDGIECYQTNGTPVDCVRLATSVLNKKFDIVFSGINDGLNIGTDIIYSGTVGAAREAFIEYIPSVALSVDHNFSIANNELDNVLEMIFKNKLYSKEYTLNVNFPIGEYDKSNGIKFARQGLKRFKTEYGKNDEGNYVPVNDKITYDTNEDTDVFLASKGYITLVPLRVDQTDLDSYNRLK